MTRRLLAPILSIVALACVAKVERPAQPQKQTHAASATLKTTNDPCSWLSEHDATEALGQRVLRTSPPAPTYCKYAAPATAADMLLSVVFTVDDDVASYDGFVQRDDASSIAGLGDRAVWNTNGNSLVVVKGKRRLILSVFDGKSPSVLSEADLQQKAVAAAQKVVDRM